MKKIDKLTPEQEALMEVYRDKWLKIGLCTEPANRPLAEEGMRLAYKCAGLEPPKQILWADSPLAGMKLQSHVANGEDAPIEPYWCGYGQHSAGWLAFYDYFDNIGLEGMEPIRGLVQVAQNAGWWWVFDEVAIISERMSSLHRDDQNRLHNTSGPAITYPDGWSLYFYHGIRVPEWLIMEPHLVTADKIKTEDNAELRRVMIAILGLDKWIIQGGFKAKHTDKRGELYADDEGRQVVKVICSTKGESYFLPVPPEMETAEQAVAWTFNKTPGEYNPAIET